MNSPRVVMALALVAFAPLALAGRLAAAEPTASSARRAVAWLAAEVPKWSRENGCYSCHNNGDAARALIAAFKSGTPADRAPLADTLRFLSAPERWDANGPEGPFKDKKLARIQFAAALAAASRAGLIADRAAIKHTAPLVAELQTADGYWETDVPGSVGSPATYGRALATALAIDALAAADSRTYAPAIARGQRWFEATPVKTVLDAAAALLALSESEAAAADKTRQTALALIRQGESPDGGWGPFVNSPAETFDTALVVLALARQPKQAELAPLVKRGRAYLIAQQSPDGSWPATTRPAGATSYAQQVSTTAWATMALLSGKE